MKIGLHTGDIVRHQARPEWGMGKITSVHSCGTIRVLFDGNKILSIAKGIKHLKRVDVQSDET